MYVWPNVTHHPPPRLTNTPPNHPLTSIGRLHQVEYAIEAINNAGTCVGVLCKDGIVLAGALCTYLEHPTPNPCPAPTDRTHAPTNPPNSRAEDDLQATGPDQDLRQDLPDRRPRRRRRRGAHLGRQHPHQPGPVGARSFFLGGGGCRCGAAVVCVGALLFRVGVGARFFCVRCSVSGGETAAHTHTLIYNHHPYLPPPPIPTPKSNTTQQAGRAALPVPVPGDDPRGAVGALHLRLQAGLHAVRRPSPLRRLLPLCRLRPPPWVGLGDGERCVWMMGGGHHVKQTGSSDS